MEKYRFSTVINAPKEKVWEILWGKDTYPAWTSAFSEGSTAETDGWKKGTKVLFTDGKGSGMVSMVADNRPPEFMSFEHIGMLKEGIEDTESEKVKEWAGAHENYMLTEADGTTTLVVDIDLEKEWLDYMQKAWPLALEKLKTISEGK